MTDTVFALATPPGRSAVAVVRLSGPNTGEILRSIGGRLPQPRRASVRRLRDPDTRALLDQAVVLWMPGPASFTGEDAGELHLHGGMAVISAVTGALQRFGGRPAAAGEFTRRAFEHGKLDLSRAEAVADLVDAETDAQRRQALQQLGGATSARPAMWREALIEIAGLMEAGIDFPDEALPGGLDAEALDRLTALRSDLIEAAGDLRGERIRDGYRVALIGLPNAGKSSLLNALLERDAAIVTEHAGTTRDIIEAPLVLAGYRILLADTAGLRETSDPIELEGVGRARRWGASADLRLWVVDRSADALDAAPDLKPGDMVVLAKSDLPSGAAETEARRLATRLGLVCVNTRADFEGVTELRDTVSRHVATALGGADAPLVTRLRHRAAIEDAVGHLDRACGSATAVELAAEDVRLAARALERISGRVDTEQVLDAVFSRFCIGK